jgi:class 3 adenylate cyclase
MDLMSEYEQIEQAIAVLEAQRAILGDVVVETALAPLREKLVALDARVPEQQRKQVTVLFADVSGFTAMSEAMDAEDVTEMMNALWERLDETIIEYGGFIDKHIGDAVMTMWGAVTAHEDDPEQAIRAALAMQVELAAFRKERRIDLAMRIGVNTGAVLLGEVGTTGEYTAMGDTVNVASRLEHAAPLGSVLVSHGTYRHVRGVFDVQVLEPIGVRGKTEPIQVYLVERAKPRAFRKGTRGVEGVETRMIGREGELKRLQDAFHTAVEDSECQVVTIIGEAGVGKSRLLYEFDIWAELRSQEFYYFKGRASEEMQNVPYALICDLFCFRFQIRDNDPFEIVRAKMKQGIEEALGEDEQAEMKTHFIGQLLGFDYDDSRFLKDALDDPEQLRDRAAIYVIDYFKAMAAQDPVLILLEDVHWADESSLDLLALWDLAGYPQYIGEAPQAC